jgi:plasmid stabilization system protein ParE
MSARERHAYHEAGHALVCQVLGLRVHYASASETGGRTLHEAARNPLERAVVLWSGAVAETLAGPGQDARSWLRQPDAGELRKLPAHIVNRGLEEAQRIVSEHETEVRALAEHLEVSSRLSGWKIRRIIRDPEIRPRRQRPSDGVPVSESFA